MSIHINNLTFSHDDSPLLHDLSFSVEKNQIGFVSGSSGIGKSTLFNIIAGLILPENGKIMLDDTLLNDKNFSLETEKRKVGYVFQELNLFPHLTNAQNIHFAKPGLPKEEVEELVTKLNLTEHLQTYPHLISGGQQQRIAIARALVAEPAILLVDEATGNLDLNSGDQIMDVLDQLNQNGTTICMVTHESRYADRASTQLKLLDGAILTAPTTQEAVSAAH